MYLASTGSSFRIYLIFTAAGVPFGGRKTSSLTSSYCRLYIFWSFGVIGLILSHFENRALQKPVLMERVDSVAIQSTLVISTSVISNNRLSRRENLVLVLTQKFKIRSQNIVEKRRNCSWGAISPLFHYIFNIYF